MKRFVQCVGVAAALTLVASPAHAVVNSWTFSGCGGNSFSTCFSVDASEVNGVFVLEVTNDGAAQPGSFESVFTAIGFADLPFDITGFAQAPTGAGNWQYSDDINDLNGVVTAGDYAGGECHKAGNPGNACNPNDDALQPGETVTFFFDFDGAFDLTGGIFGIHGQQGPNDCSTKVFTTVGGSPNQPTGSTENCGGPDTAIPEPITMALLGTGLAGMGGANLLRRRRKNEDEVV